VSAPDWTKEEDYTWTGVLARREWAWEFLRRNPEFRSDWNSAQLEYGVSGYDAGTTMLVGQHQRPGLSKWGCLYTTSPKYDARMASVFWDPAICPSVLHLRAFGITEHVPATPFSLDDMACPSLLLELPDSPQQLLFAEGGRSLQLVIEGGDVMKRVRLMTDGAPGVATARPQLQALRCFNDLRLSGRLYPSHVQRDALSVRLRSVLRVLDASLAGAPQQQIAQVMFPDEFAGRSWDTCGQLLRDRIRRALRRGYGLMQKGYLGLLA
jgi:hypothetical protein